MMKLKYLILTLLFLSPLCLNAQQDAELSALLGGMVQSDRWIIRKDKFEEEFIGNVHYENDIYKIHADRALSKRKAQTYTLEGNVFASRSEKDTKAQISAHKIFYNKKSDLGYAEPKKGGSLDLIYIIGKNKFRLNGNKLAFAGKGSSFKIEGDAELHDINNTLYAENMAFDTKTGIFEAYGRRPVFWGFNDEGDYALQADNMTVLTKEKQIKAQGRVRGWITSTTSFANLKDRE